MQLVPKIRKMQILFQKEVAIMMLSLETHLMLHEIEYTIINNYSTANLISQWSIVSEWNMNKPKKTLETFTLVLHVSMKTFAFASARMGLLMNITYSFLEKTPHIVTTINIDGGTPVRSYFTKKHLKKKYFSRATFHWLLASFWYRRRQCKVNSLLTSA